MVDPTETITITYDDGHTLVLDVEELLNQPLTTYETPTTSFDPAPAQPSPDYSFKRVAHGVG